MRELGLANFVGPSGLLHEQDKSGLLLERAVEKLFDGLEPRPSCIISDMSFPSTSFLAKKHGIPRIRFNGFSCLAPLCVRNVETIREFLDRLEPSRVDEGPVSHGYGRRRAGLGLVRRREDKSPQ
ncbi:unnamed protein product [Linum trigynum]|uniref:Uncharacterized protein n=1 Tax=Linum trigynum TaxID=586398 RepID=A0AAV2FJ47_9ROSI